MKTIFRLFYQHFRASRVEIRITRIRNYTRKNRLWKRRSLFSKENTLLIIETKGICWNATGKNERTKDIKLYESQATKYAAVLG